MFFSYSSAIRAVNRNRRAGGNAYAEKRWYGWIVVDPANSVGMADHIVETNKKVQHEQ